MRFRALALSGVVLVLSLVSYIQWNSQPRSAHAVRITAPPAGFSNPRAPFVLIARPVNDTVRLGEPVAVDLFLLNISGEPVLTYARLTMSDELDVIVRSPSGDTIPLIDYYEPDYQDSTIWVLMPRDGIYGRRLLLTCEVPDFEPLGRQCPGGFRFDQIGRYLIDVWLSGPCPCGEEGCTPCGSDRPWTGILSTGEFAITIVN